MLFYAYYVDEWQKKTNAFWSTNDMARTGGPLFRLLLLHDLANRIFSEKQIEDCLS